MITCGRCVGCIHCIAHAPNICTVMLHSHISTTCFIPGILKCVLHARTGTHLINSFKVLGGSSVLQEWVQLDCFEGSMIFIHLNTFQLCLRLELLKMETVFFVCLFKEPPVTGKILFVAFTQNGRLWQSG